MSFMEEMKTGCTINYEKDPSSDTVHISTLGSGFQKFYGACEILKHCALNDGGSNPEDYVTTVCMCVITELRGEIKNDKK